MLAPIALCSLAGATAMLLAGCITAREAYARVEWPIIVLIAATLPMGVAMEKTGAAKLAAQYVTRHLGDFGPIMVMGGFFLFAVALLLPLASAPLWGRQYGASLVAAVAALWVLPAAAFALLGYLVYQVLEWLARRLGLT